MTARPAFPLRWPLNRPRRMPQARKPGITRKRFDRAWDELVGLVEDDLHATDMILSSNVELLPSGLPDPDRATRPSDPGVALYFVVGGKPWAIGCDAYQTVCSNIVALAGVVRVFVAMRAFDEVLFVQALEAFRGDASIFAQVAAEEEARERNARRMDEFIRESTAHAQAARAAREAAPRAVLPTERPWWEVLGVAMTADLATVRRAHRALAMRYHPDRADAHLSGPAKEAAQARFNEVTNAWKRAKKLLEVRG